MDTELTPELEISAARMDLWLAKSRLEAVTHWMRRQAGIPEGASFWFAYLAYKDREAAGDKLAARKLAEFSEAATAYEGARVALIELTGSDDPDAATEEAK